MGASEIVNEIWQQALEQRLRPGQKVSFTVSIITKRRAEERRSGMASDKKTDSQIAQMFQRRWGIGSVETRRRADQTSFTFVVSEPFAERRMLAVDKREHAERKPMVTRHGQLIFT